MIIRWNYQADSKDARWEYEPVSDLWPDIEPDNDSSDDGSSDEVRKYQDNPDYQEQEEVMSVPRRNPRILRQGNKREIQLLKSNIKNSNDKLFFVKHRTTGSEQAKFYLVQVEM